MEPWHFVFLVGFIVYVAIRGVFKRRTKGNEKAVSRVDAVEKMLLAFVIPGALLLPIIDLALVSRAGTAVGKLAGRMVCFRIVCTHVFRSHAS